MSRDGYRGLGPSAMPTLPDGMEWNVIPCNTTSSQGRSPMDPPATEVMVVIMSGGKSIAHVLVDITDVRSEQDLGRLVREQAHELWDSSMRELNLPKWIERKPWE